MGTLTVGWDNVRKGRREKPDRIFLYAEDKFGKSVFASGAAKPIYLDFENGTAEIDTDGAGEPLQSFDLRKATIEAIHEHLDFILATPGDRRTLVIDTLDAMEKCIQTDICRKEGAEGIEDVGGGYGKGWTRLEEEVRRVFGKLDDFTEKGMTVIVLAHSHTVTAVNPNGADFRKFEPRMEKRTLGIPKDWADVILFGAFENQIVNADKRNRMGKAVGGRKRVIHTVKSATWDAGNRYGLSARLNLTDNPKENYPIYSAARAAVRDSVEKMLTEADTLLAKIGNDDERKAIRAWLDGNKENHSAVLAGLNRLRERVEAAQSVAKDEPKAKKEVA